MNHTATFIAQTPSPQQANAYEMLNKSRKAVSDRHPLNKGETTSEVHLAILTVIENMIARKHYDAAFWTTTDLVTADQHPVKERNNYYHALRNLEHILDGLRNPY